MSETKSGCFLKQGKHLGTWKIDPFSLSKDGNHLVASRGNKRFFFFKQTDYSLIRLHVSDLRKFRQEEFVHVVSSKIGVQLDDDFKLSVAICFDIRFGIAKDEKLMTVFGVNRKQTEELHEFMRLFVAMPETVPVSEANGVEMLLVPIPQPEIDQILSSSNTGVPKEPLVVSTRLTMPTDQA